MWYTFVLARIVGVGVGVVGVGVVCVGVGVGVVCVVCVGVGVVCVVCVGVGVGVGVGVDVSVSLLAIVLVVVGNMGGFLFVVLACVVDGVVVARAGVSYADMDQMFYLRVVARGLLEPTNRKSNPSCRAVDDALRPRRTPAAT